MSDVCDEQVESSEEVIGENQNPDRPLIDQNLERVTNTEAITDPNKSGCGEEVESHEEVIGENQNPDRSLIDEDLEKVTNTEAITDPNKGSSDCILHCRKTSSPLTSSSNLSNSDLFSQTASGTVKNSNSIRKEMNQFQMHAVEKYISKLEASIQKKAFGNISYMIKHAEKITLQNTVRDGEFVHPKTYQCGYCNKNFLHCKVFLKHIRRHTMDVEMDLVRCEICAEIFTRSKFKNKHRREAHQSLMSSLSQKHVQPQSKRKAPNQMQ